ncbi:tubulin-specific chaperone E [Coniella lustricola]|uniref:Tubulin-specific chaperone E n=1 Tax=Coniella lustricola TaxID=2025994 RepID=A0A2T2ZXA4_9PEZI|nr:tubulin-specific chaperone E [Coniella lustricola]
MSQAGPYSVGQRLSYGNAVCTVRYIGQVSGTTGDWLGVEWDEPSRGKHDGSHKGTRYFTTRSKSPTAASFVRPTRPADTPRTFLEALQAKYASEVTADHKPISSGPQIVISGKVAEEIGFDKIRKQQAQLGELKYVILDAMCIDAATAKDRGQQQQQQQQHKEEAAIRDICPKVIELDISRNLFTDLGPVVDICSNLSDLRSLRINGNRFLDVLEVKGSQDAETAFQGIKELGLEETLLSWHDICLIASRFRKLATLYANLNQLTRLSPIPASTLTTTLTSVHLEFNYFTSLSDLASLATATNLRNLHLKGNNIAAVSSDSSEPAPVFSPTLAYLDISYNKIPAWTFVDALPDSFPGLTSLRLAHNPIYDNPALVVADPTANDATTTTTATATTTVTEEAYMLTVARLATLKSLNYSAVTPNDRNNAEMFYLSRIGRQLSAVPDTPAAEAAVLAQHRRYAQLCELYGEPVVNRRQEVNPAFLEARLVNVAFRFCFVAGSSAAGGSSCLSEKMAANGAIARNGKLQQNDSREQANNKLSKRNIQIPKSLDIYAVKGIASRLFGYPPLSLRLIWETGEWDPVAGFDEEASDSDDDDKEEEEVNGNQENYYLTGDKEVDGTGTKSRTENNNNNSSSNKAGRWIKREVELTDSPRQFGFCVDGLDVSIRVEPR